MNDSTAVRRANKGDLDPVSRLWKAFLDEQAALDERFQVADDALDRFRNDFPVWLDDDTQRIFVAERAAGRSAEIVGFAAAHRWAPPPIFAAGVEVYVRELYVSPEVRRRGIGRQLATAVRRWAASLGAARLRLSTLAANADGCAFWKQQEAMLFYPTFTVELSSGTSAPEEPSPRRALGFY